MTEIIDPSKLEHDTKELCRLLIKRRRLSELSRRTGISYVWFWRWLHRSPDSETGIRRLMLIRGHALRLKEISEM